MSMINITSGKHWTKEEDEFLKANYGGNLSVNQIAEKLERSAGSVYARANKRLKLSAKHKLPKALQESQLKKEKTIKELSIEEIAFILESAVKKEEKELLDRISYIQQYKELLKK